MSSILTYAKSLESFVHLPPTPPDFLDGLGQDEENSTTQLALHVLKTERDALSSLHDLYLTNREAQRSLNEAISIMSKSSSRGGRIIVSGVGKSGKIGQKFVATLNSLAVPSTFLHPIDALHGDLGLIGQVRLVFCPNGSG